MPFTLGGDYISDDEQKRHDKTKKPVKIQVEKRKNSVVTIVSNLPLLKEEMQTLLKEMKRKLGSGGSLKNDTIEIQGNHADKVRAYLNQNRPDFKVQ